MPLSGFEPETYSLEGCCSIQLSYRSLYNLYSKQGKTEIRSQYISLWDTYYNTMVELRRVELLTSCVQGRRSSQMSYSPIYSIIIVSEFGQGWIRTSVAFRRRIYSPLHLTALPPTRIVMLYWFYLWWSKHINSSKHMNDSHEHQSHSQ